MKRLVVLVMAGIIIAMLTLVGCGYSEPNYDIQPAIVVDVNVESDKNNETEKWIKYTFWANDASKAYEQCKTSYYYHLDCGETVSEIIETSNEKGETIYYFKTKGKAVAG